MAEYLTHEGESTSQSIPAFMREWGVDMELVARGGIEGVEAKPEPSRRSVSLLQRKQSKVGAGLGKTTGWIHRAGLEKRAVAMIPGCEYEKIDDDGLHVLVNGERKLFAVDNVILCAGQDPQRELAEAIKGKPVHLIGGADFAAELDAKRAIDQGTRLAAAI